MAFSKDCASLSKRRRIGKKSTTSGDERRTSKLTGQTHPQAGFSLCDRGDRTSGCLNQPGGFPTEEPLHELNLVRKRN